MKIKPKNHFTSIFHVFLNNLKPRELLQKQINKSTSPFDHFPMKNLYSRLPSTNQPTSSSSSLPHKIPHCHIRIKLRVKKSARSFYLSLALSRYLYESALQQLNILSESLEED